MRSHLELFSDIYSRPGKRKLRNIAANPRVMLTLDETALGSDVVRVEGTARHVAGHPPAVEVGGYVAKYGEHIAAAGFGTPERFSAMFSKAIVVSAYKAARIRARDWTRLTPHNATRLPLRCCLAAL